MDGGEGLGDEKLNYVGYSYGTSIGQMYAELFPTRIRAMVLDGVVDTSQTGLEGGRRQAAGLRAGARAFVDGLRADATARSARTPRP